MTNDEQIGERLRAFQMALKITQTVLAQHAGVKQGFLSQVFSGKKQISAKVLINITCAFKTLNLRWLLTGEGEMFEPERTYRAPPSEVHGGVEDVSVEYFGQESELEQIKRLLHTHEQRLRALENKAGQLP